MPLQILHLPNDRGIIEGSLCRFSSAFVGAHIFARETDVAVVGVRKGSSFGYVCTLAKLVWRNDSSSRSGCRESVVIANWDVLSAAQLIEHLFFIDVIIRVIIGVVIRVTTVERGPG
jgi:hypothetical protein